MKQHWAPQELIDHWMLTDTEKTLVNQYHTDPNRIASALLLKFFQREGKFPQRKQDIPRVIVEHIAQQLHLETTVFDSYRWGKGTIDRHRSHLRKFLGVRMGTVADANTILQWLEGQSQLLEEHNFDRLKEIVYERYKELKIEPPQPKRIERLVRSAVRSADERLYKKVVDKLTPETQTKLEALLSDTAVSEKTSLLSTLKSEAGAATLENILTEIAKLERIRSLSLPPDLFAGVLQKRLLWCKRRIAVEDLSEIRRHPPQVRYSLLAAFCIVRSEEIIDTL
jgi:Domain of unknown function (DUF4158)